MLALSIRQPYAELILRGIKTVESARRPTRIIGERFYIYASKAKAARPIWSDDLRVATPPKWMIELAEQVGMIEPGALLPTGVIVGSARDIEKVTPPDPSDAWRVVPLASHRCQTRQEVSQASRASSAGLVQSVLTLNKKPGRGTERPAGSEKMLRSDQAAGCSCRCLRLSPISSITRVCVASATFISTSRSSRPKLYVLCHLPSSVR